MWFKEGSGAGVVCPPAAGPQLLTSVGTPYTSTAWTPLNTAQTMHNVQSVSHVALLWLRKQPKITVDCSYSIPPHKKCPV